MSGDILLLQLGKGTGIYWVETRDALKHPEAPRMVPYRIIWCKC